MTRRPACSAGVDSQGVVALLYVVAALIARTVPLTNLPALVLAASFAYVPLVALCAVLLAALCRKLSRCPSGPFAGHLGWPSGLNWARISVVSAAICSSSWRLVFTGAPFGGGVEVESVLLHRSAGERADDAVDVEARAFREFLDPRPV